MSLILRSTKTKFPPQQTGLSLISEQAMSLPAYMVPTRDPSLGNIVTRVTDQTVFGASVNILTHFSMNVQVWNADDTRMFLSGTKYSEGYLLDGNGKFLQKITVSTAATGNLGMYNASSARWSHVNPNNMYGILSGYRADLGTACNSDNKMVVWHPKTDTAALKTLTLLHTFSQFDDFALTGNCPNMTFGEAAGDFSHDDRLGAVVGWSSAQQSWGFCSFYISNPMSNTPTVTEIATLWLGPAGGTTNQTYGADTMWNFITATPYGDGFVVGWNLTGAGPMRGTDWYSPDFTRRVHITDSYSHSDLGIDATGKQMYVNATGGFYTGLSGTPKIAGYVLGPDGPTGDNRSLLPNVPLNQVNDRIHLSCRNELRPGWVYISDFQNVNDQYQYGYKLIYALSLDGNQTIEPVAINHGSVNNVANDNTYAARATPSRDGRRVAFASDWGETDVGRPGHLFITRRP